MMEKRSWFFHPFFPIVLMLGLFIFIDPSWAVTPKISAGAAHVIVVKSDGTLWAWGYNRYGQLGDGTTVYRHPPARIGTETHWADVAASKWNHTIAMKSDGSLWAWGLNSSGQLGDGTTINKTSPIRIGTATDWTEIAAGPGYNMALKLDGTLWGWGENGVGQLGDGTTTHKPTPVQMGTEHDWGAVAVGWDHTVAVKKDGTLWAWGYNAYGQLGDDTRNERHSPVLVGTDNTWAAMSAGGDYTIALKLDGTLWSWGGNWYGQLGDVTWSEKHSPVKVGTDTDWAAIAAGRYHSIALKWNGTLWGWGSNQFGPLGEDNTDINKYSPIQIGSETDWVAIAAGEDYTIALKSNGSIWTWGDNRYGQLGDGTNGYQSTPVQIGTETDWASVATGDLHAVALKKNRTLWTWGYNWTGQLGDGTTVQRNSPVQIGHDDDWQAIAAGFDHTVGLKTDGTLWAWGRNYEGQLGDGTMVGSKEVPAQVGQESDWIQVSSGQSHIVSLKSNMSLWAWGKNNLGQLGDGSTVNKGSPVQIDTVNDWTEISAGYNHTMALKSDGTLWGWGENWAGQLGDGTTADKHTPIQIGTENDWDKISAGESDTVASKKNGTLWAWGTNWAGQLGDGTKTQKVYPDQVGNENDWAEIAAGRGGHTVALKKNGTLWIWGENEFGQLGDGTTDDRTLPVQMGKGTDWDLAAPGRNHTMGLKSNGTLWAWGDNYYGQLGNGLKAFRSSPVMVFTVGHVSIFLVSPSNEQAFTGCSYYSLPTFSWYAVETFKSFETQFSLDQSFSSIPVRVKVNGTVTEIQMKSSTMKKIISMPGAEGGAVYWRVVGTKANKETLTSDVRMISISGGQPVGSMEISPTQKSSLPMLSWENKCNKKFKVWFGNDSSFTKKSNLSFSLTNPMDNGGEFERQLTSSQWTGIRKLVGDASGSTIYWKVESWDGMNRYAQTDVMSFVLAD